MYTAAEVPRVREVVSRKAFSPQRSAWRVIHQPSTAVEYQEPTLNTMSSRLNRLRTLTIDRQQAKQKAALAARTLAPFALAVAFSGVAHAQGTMDFSGATTLMQSFKTDRKSVV